MLVVVAIHEGSDMKARRQMAGNTLGAGGKGELIVGACGYCVVAE